MSANQAPYGAYPNEKEEFSHVENGVVGHKVADSDIERGSDAYVDDGVHRQWADVDEGFDPKEISRIVRKIDWRLLPILGAMYTISQIDRGNLGLARSANNGKMNRELGLDYNNGNNNRYSIITLAFFIPYLILEVPVSVVSEGPAHSIWL